MLITWLKINACLINYFLSGYQRELRYKRKSGSYSAFGDSDRRGSMMQVEPIQDYIWSKLQ